MKLHCREGSGFFYFEESQISATEKKNKAISLGNSHQEVIVSSRDWAIKNLNWVAKASWLYKTYVISGICHTWRVLKDDCVEAYSGRRISRHSFCLFSPFDVVLILRISYQCSKHTGDPTLTKKEGQISVTTISSKVLLLLQRIVTTILSVLEGNDLTHKGTWNSPCSKLGTAWNHKASRDRSVGQHDGQQTWRITTLQTTT